MDGRLLFLVCFLSIGLCSTSADNGSPYKTENSEKKHRDTLDALFIASLAKHGLEPAAAVSDAVFCRRIYIDLTGSLPSVSQVRQFLKNSNPEKRSDLVNQLMETDAFTAYWTMKWCDLLRVKAEFPINMWPNGVQVYARWIHECIASNLSCDKFVRELLTASGSNFRVPPVNFYRGVQGEESSAYATAVALTFMGTRLETWPVVKQEEMAVFFSRIKVKSTAEWKEFIVSNDPEATSSLEAILPSGNKVIIKAGDDPRDVFADWLLSPGNEWFARSIANRAWSWFFGHGLIDEPDDIRPDNPPVHPEVLDYLEKVFVESGYDIRKLFRVILNSSAYQQVSYFEGGVTGDRELFAHYPVRRLDAEVLLDALSQISGNQESYMSMIPEPFTFIPPRNTSVALTDGSITSKFLKMFGRPERDTGLESERDNKITEEQRLHMLNSTHVADKISKGWKLKSVAKKKVQTGEVFDELYLAILSRFPTDEERIQSREYVKKKGVDSGTSDLFWSLVNSKEFMYRH